MHEYAVRVGPELPAHEAFLDARSLLVGPVAVLTDGGDETLPREASFAEARGKGVAIAGVQLEDGELSLRVVNLREKPVTTRLQGLADMEGATVSPSGALKGRSLRLGPKAVREIRVAR